jgi:hypothetical protein
METTSWRWHLQRAKPAQDTFRRKISWAFLALGALAIFSVLTLGCGSDNPGDSSTSIPTAPPAQTPTVAINAGGTAAGAFSADAYFTGGTVSTTTTAIDTSAATLPAPQEVYQSERWGACSCTIPGLTAGASYLVRLHFAEIYWTTAGKRQFNVQINGVAVLTDFDLFQATGAAFKAIIKEFNTLAGADGKIVVQFSAGSADQPKISGLEIIPVETPAPLPPTGLGANPDEFNQVTLNWTDTNHSLAAYNIHRSTTSGFTAEAANRIASSVLGTTFVDSTVSANTTYFYAVTAINAKGESSPSSQTQATTPGPRILGLLATDIQSEKIGLAWNSLAGATAFRVYRSTTQGFVPGPANQIAAPAAAACEDASVAPSTEYYYRVTALIAGQETSASDELHIKTPAHRFGNISPYLLGQNDWYSLPDGVWAIVKESRVGCVRIGGAGYDGGPMDNATLLHHVDMIRSAGAEPLIQVSRFASAARAADMVTFINKVSGRNVMLWSIGNEPDLGYSGSEDQLAAVVASYTKERSAAMRDVDPTIQIFAGEMAWYSATKYSDLLGGSTDITGKDAKGRFIIDGITFHTYPFGNTYTRQNVLDNMHTAFPGTVNALLSRVASANALQGRTGSSALKWGLTEFNVSYKNPGANGPGDCGVSSFLNGQLFAEYFRTGMARQACMMNTWSINEGGGSGGEGDLGYLGGSATNPTFRSSYYHMQLIGKYLLDGNDSTYLDSTSSSVNVTSIATSTITDRVVVMVLNEDMGSHNLAIRLKNDAVQAAGDAKIQVNADLPVEYTDGIAGQSTLVLVFDNQGVLKTKITYSEDDCANNRPPVVENH